MTASLHMHPSTAQAALFTGTIFVGAVLLFWIQPLFTKMALPLLGDSPLVWNTAMVFFQAMLLAGYAYAHLLGRWLGARGQLVVHALVLGAAALALPIAPTSAPTSPRRRCCGWCRWRCTC